MRKDRVPYNTNLAAEFWVLSALYRLGVEAHLTLGNKKSVDILLIRDSKTICTIDVKGVADPYDWPADNIKVLDNPNHFFVFLSFEGKILDLLASPSVWIIPSNQTGPFIKRYKTRVVISRALVKRDGSEFKDAWRYFSKIADAELRPVSTL
jgi:hypothetical protein